ncbi:hypothetical protein MNB_SV-14-243 [hydrothermal vent metagenome]|uniref:Uncharacterized protein n=1 Tax=hydrothermal vent metagenome TaxID=652676 RepID=A0A1W1C7J5_9ZZZZ
MRLLLSTLLLVLSLNAQSGILNIKWPKPNPQQQKPSTPYPSVLTKGIKNTRLPVYIPSSFAYDKNMIVVVNNNFYTISFILQGATLMVSGDRTFQDTISNSNSDLQKIMKPSPAVEFTQEEGMMSANFNRHGANYELLIECDKPKIDKRCKEDTFLRKIYNKLIMVGGRP